MKYEINESTLLKKIINKIKLGKELNEIEKFILTLILYGTPQQLLIALIDYKTTFFKN